MPPSFGVKYLFAPKFSLVMITFLNGPFKQFLVSRTDGALNPNSTLRSILYKYHNALHLPLHQPPFSTKSFSLLKNRSASVAPMISSKSSSSTSTSLKVSPMASVSEIP